MRSGSLLLASAFHRESTALSTGALKFVVLSGRPIEAICGLAQRDPLHAWHVAVLNRHRLARVRESAHRRDFDFGNLPR